ncbi:MAG: VanZ family protein, partial [Planctomycetota bacterium]|nr:VanZ family protein [Planctomycetota bacterium]
WWLNDKMLHTIGYAILGFLTAWMIGQAGVGDRWRASALSLAGLFVYAAFDEMTQPLVGRSCEFSDWLADAAGAAIGTLAGVRWQLRRKTE